MAQVYHSRLCRSRSCHVLHVLYQEMFQHEHPTRMFANLNLQTLQNNSLPLNTRGSFVGLLRFVKKRVLVDWSNTKELLLGLMESDSSLLVGRNYLQELIGLMHIHEVYSCPALQIRLAFHTQSRVVEGLGFCEDISPVTCVTLKVPRRNLQVFTNIPANKLGTPIVHAFIGSNQLVSFSGWQNTFAVVNLCFGKITTSGSRYTGDFSVQIEEDEAGWAGTSPQAVSFYVLSWTLLKEPQAATVSFGIQSTPDSAQKFVGTLGMMLEVYKTTLGDEENVFISKRRPNHLADPVICAGVQDIAAAQASNAINTVASAHLNRGSRAVVTFTARVGNFPDDAKTSLKNAAVVEIEPASLFAVAVIIGGNKIHHIQFPMPFDTSSTKTRISRKDAWIEVTARIVDPTSGERIPNFTCPLFVNGAKPILWNMPSLFLDSMPILHPKEDFKWLSSHAAHQLSVR